MEEVLTTLSGKAERAALRVLQSVPDWPCRRGCDACCRTLARQPLLTGAEWDVLRPAIDQLAAPVRRLVLERCRGLAAQPRPIVCPFLDPDHGECLVYDSRPIACRTYGFYVGRDGGQYCRQIEERAGRGEFAGIVWGNHESMEAALDALGPRHPLTHWLGESC